MINQNIDIGPDTNLLNNLINVWIQKRHRNNVRSVYYDGEAALKDFGISLPPQMQNIRAALGWVTKGVHAVTDRSHFEGFVSTSGSSDPLGLGQIASDNRFDVEFPAATVSSAVHGCSFITVTQGDVQSGEPEILMLPRAADRSAAIWDDRKRALRGFLSIIETEENSDYEPSYMVLYTPERVYQLEKLNGRWKTSFVQHRLGRVPAAPLTYGYELRRPLGHSRITRAAMHYSDSALRTIVRAEVSAEFYSAPEYYLFGADVQDFVGSDKWTAIMGRIKAKDVEDGEDKPSVQRFEGSSPQPHTDQLLMWAQLFGDDQDLDVKFADSSKPTSAESIFAAKETLITTTERANRTWGYGAVDAARMAVQLRDGVLDDEARGLSAQFTDPAIVSPGARADSFVKLASAIDGFGASEVGLEYAGLSREQITRFQAEQRRMQVSSLISSLGQSADSAKQDPQVEELSGQRGSSGTSEPPAGV